MTIAEIRSQIEKKALSLAQVDDLLIHTSWLEQPDLIRTLLAYRGSACDVIQQKTAQEIKAEWKTEKLPNGTLRLVNYNGEDSVVVVPNKIGNAVVSEIGSYALSAKKPRLKKEQKDIRLRIEKIVIPQTVKIIGEHAFDACDSLAKVTWAASIKEIGNYAFCDCIRLEAPCLHQGLKRIGQGTFEGCATIKKIAIPESVNKLPPRIFARCESLTEIQLHDGITVIGEQAFFDCSKLKKIKLPINMKTLSHNLFSGCSNLSEVQMPIAPTSIGYNAFVDCKKLLTLTIPQTVRYIQDREYNYCGTFLGCSKNLVLQVKAGTYAERYAKRNKIKYSIL